MYLNLWRRSITEIVSSNISDPLPKKSDNPSEKVIKTSGYLYETEKALVTTTVMVVKEGNTYMGKKDNVLKEAITNPISKKRIDKFNKQRNQKHPIKQ